MSVDDCTEANCVGELTSTDIPHSACTIFSIALMRSGCLSLSHASCCMKLWYFICACTMFATALSRSSFYEPVPCLLLHISVVLIFPLRATLSRSCSTGLKIVPYSHLQELQHAYRVCAVFSFVRSSDSFTSALHEFVIVVLSLCHIRLISQSNLLSARYLFGAKFVSLPFVGQMSV